MTLLVRGAEVGGRHRDVRLGDGVILELADRLSPRPGEDLIVAAGGALLPGLHDHHVHLGAMAAAAGSVVVGPPEVHDRSTLAARLRRASAGCQPNAWIRATGYHESVAGDLDHRDLDSIVSDRPVRLQHRSGTLWVLNSEAIRRTGLAELDRPGIERRPDGSLTGRLWRADRWLAGVVPTTRLDFAQLSARAAATGVTGFTDATPNEEGDVSWLSGALRDGAICQRLHLMTAPEAVVPPAPLITPGPVKLLLDDPTLPPLDELKATVDRAHESGRPVALHCVTIAQLVLTCAALADAGPARGDRVEHAAVVPIELTEVLGRLGATVVTQPNFIAERGDRYALEVDPADLDGLYRCRSLITAGVPVAFGTDAPFGGSDPWAAMSAAVERRTPDGVVLGPDERITPLAALKAFLGDARSPSIARRLRAGAPADLCLLRVPLGPALRRPDASLVALTIVGGRVVADNR